MLILSGQRLGEVAGMRWSEIDFDKRVWRLPAERVKNKRPHEVPLTAQMLAILDSLPRVADRDIVFSTTRRDAVVGLLPLQKESRSTPSRA